MMSVNEALRQQEHSIIAKLRRMRQDLKHMVDDLNERDNTTYALMLQASVVDLQKMEAFADDLSFEVYW